VKDLSIRALSKGFTLAKRSKRTWVFMILFSLLIWMIAVNINQIHRLETDELLNLRGVSVLFTSGIMTEKQFAQSNFIDIINDVSEYTRGVYLLCGSVLRLDLTTIAFVWLKPYQNMMYSPELSWVVEQIKPTKIVEGRALNMDSERDAIVGKRFSINFQVSDKIINVSATIGSKVEFKFGTKLVLLEIVGVSSDDFSSFAELLSKATGLSISASSILFTTQNFVKERGGEIINPDNTYILRVIFTAKGEIGLLNIAAGRVIDANRNKIESRIKESAYSGLLGEISPKISGREYEQTMVIVLTSTLIMILITLMYAFILVSFRKYDIATLRAIGWGSKHIFMLTLGEFTLTILLGYFVGVISSMVFFTYNRVPFSHLAYVGAFGIVILSLLIGLLIIRQRVLKIPPMEAFRMH